MAYELLNPTMHKLTRNELVVQDSIPMLDGSALLYNIDITLQTDDGDESHAYQNIKSQSTENLIKPIEQLLVNMLRKYDDDIESDPDDDGGMSDLLTADDPQCAQ